MRALPHEQIHTITNTITIAYSYNYSKRKNNVLNPLSLSMPKKEKADG